MKKFLDIPIQSIRIACSVRYSVLKIKEVHGGDLNCIMLLVVKSTMKAIENAQKLLADGKYTAEEISELFNIPVEDFTVDTKDEQ